MSEPAQLDVASMESIFAFLSANQINLSVKPLNKHFKHSVDKKHGRSSNIVSASSHVPAQDHQPYLSAAKAVGSFRC